MVFTVNDVELVVGARIDTGQLIRLTGPEATRHEELLGRSGAGKSRLIVSEFLQTLNQGLSAVLFDPAGETADEVLGTLIDDGFFSDPRAYQRLRYVRLGEANAFFPWNILRQPGLEPHAVASNLLEVWKRAWSSLSGGQAPQLENLVLAGGYVLVKNGLPLPCLSRLLGDEVYREGLLANVRDPEILAFFRRYSEAGRRSGMLSESTLRRVFLLSYTPALRYTLGQSENRLDLRRTFDEGTGLILDASGLDTETQRFMAAAFAMELEVAAVSRQELSPNARRPARVIIDEWAAIGAMSEESLERVLSLARKYNVCLVLAHQTVSQLSAQMQGALQNSRLLALQVGADDAGWAAKRLAVIDPNKLKFSPQGTPSFLSASEQRAAWERLLQGLPRQEAVLRLGEETVHVRAITVPTPQCTPGQLAVVKERYAKLLLTPKDQLEQQFQQGAQFSHEEVALQDMEEQLGGTEQGLRSTRRAPRLPGRIRRWVPLSEQEE